MGTDNVLISRLEEIVDRLENNMQDDHNALVKKAIENEAAKMSADQSVREKLDKLEMAIHDTNVALTETDGKVDNLKTQMNGEIKLVYEVLKGLSEKFERIEKSTSKEESIKRTWRIALIAALPGIASVIIMIIELVRSG